MRCRDDRFVTGVVGAKERKSFQAPVHWGFRSWIIVLKLYDLVIIITDL